MAANRRYVFQMENGVRTFINAPYNDVAEGEARDMLFANSCRRGVLKTVANGPHGRPDEIEVEA